MFIQQLSRLSICFAKNDITPIQFNANNYDKLWQIFHCHYTDFFFAIHSVGKEFSAFSSFCEI